MAVSVNVVDQGGKTVSTLELSEAVFGVPLRGPLLHQAVVRELAGRRAGTHDTRGRSEVSGGGKKPWRQKGTGRARQGSIRATQWKGGGKPFGPTPRSYAQALPRASRRGALCAALSDALRTGRLAVVDALQPSAPKTKALVALLGALEVKPVPTLLVVAEWTPALGRASRNVPWLRVVRLNQVSVADIVRHPQILCERGVVMAWQEALAP
jgi:large subunit ribosomal protein L4